MWFCTIEPNSSGLKQEDMDTKKTKDMRRRLSNEYGTLIESIKRNRIAAEEIKVENTEDEGDLASISRDRDLLYNLNEGGFARLRFVEEAIKALDRGQYGECSHCGEEIEEKRLDAVPWVRLCIRCQEKAEAEHTSSSMVLAGLDGEETEF
jgi:DnaK suppressor protein